MKSPRERLRERLRDELATHIESEIEYAKNDAHSEVTSCLVSSIDEIRKRIDRGSEAWIILDDLHDEFSRRMREL